MHVSKCFSPSFFKTLLYQVLFMQSVERNHYCNGNEPITHLTVWVSLCTVECLVCAYANNNYLFVVSETLFKGHCFTERAERMECF